MRLILIRHGQTPSNVAHLLDTAVPGPGLTELGHEQAAALPAALADEDIEALYVSTLVRTHLTAAPLAAARGLEPVVRDGIREVAAGDLEMLGDNESVRIYLTTVFGWSKGELDVRMPGGEDGHETMGRFDAVVAEAAGTDAGTVAMVSHGAAIRAWVAARADNVEVDWAAENALSNTGIVVLEGSPTDGWKALTWEGKAVELPEDTGTGADSGPAGRPVHDPTSR
ncbi:histidine phosphatase family protein [Cryptosporangium aurantiacum]|uniref:Probable phosphoglycerate mutase n=1 Tax=Cryptosporangium aurantiacum TaxID=134849 RepID=A0A1M7RLA3_9ACTN|nr:histidine phosphatase family protein [Cryptosporangium aurantiacum]SHN46946.1 probable phosphoglycerate mutase [Cryptosporangium aurantiacum]